MTIRKVTSEFKNSVGLTPLQELGRLRINRAKLLLADPQQKTEAIALNCGFSSRFHFFSAFERSTGRTPKEFRALTRKPSSDKS